MENLPVDHFLQQKDWAQIWKIVAFHSVCCCLTLITLWLRYVMIVWQNDTKIFKDFKYMYFVVVNFFFHSSLSVVFVLPTVPWKHWRKTQSMSCQKTLPLYKELKSQTKVPMKPQALFAFRSQWKKNDPEEATIFECSPKMACSQKTGILAINTVHLWNRFSWIQILDEVVTDRSNFSGCVSVTY